MRGPRATVQHAGGDSKDTPEGRTGTAYVRDRDASFFSSGMRPILKMQLQPERGDARIFWARWCRCGNIRDLSV